MLMLIFQVVAAKSDGNPGQTPDLLSMLPLVFGELQFAALLGESGLTYLTQLL
jgi:hypothetical protein